MTRQGPKNNKTSAASSTPYSLPGRVGGAALFNDKEMKMTRIKSFSFENKDGELVLIPNVDVEVEIQHSWETLNFGQKYHGLVCDAKTVNMLKDLGARIVDPKTSRISVYFDPIDIFGRGGLSEANLNTLRLIRLLANDLDPARPKFKSTLDSIEAHVKALKKELKIDRSVQESQIHTAKEK